MGSDYFYRLVSGAQEILPEKPQCIPKGGVLP
jgi:hypothetical protein